MEDKKVRKRISINQKGIPAVFDPYFFESNKSSPKAAKRISRNIEFTCDLWFDKHYHDRVHRGDENGPRYRASAMLASRVVAIVTFLPVCVSRTYAYCVHNFA